MPYSISVAKPALSDATPAGAAAKPHHIKDKSGTTTHFKNPYASATKAFSQWSIPFTIIKSGSCRRSLSHLPSLTLRGLGDK